MGQRLPIDTDRFGRVLGMLELVGNHEGDGIAHMADFIERQHRIGRNRDRRLGDQALARQVAELGGVGTEKRSRKSCLQQNSYSFLLAPTFPFVFRGFSMLESIQVQLLEAVWL